MCSTRVAHPAYIKEKARSLRKGGQLTIDEIAERLAPISRTTVYDWVRDLPLNRSAHSSSLDAARAKAVRANKAKYARLREIAYREGRHGFAALAQDPSFRDFVMLFMTEGYRRNRNRVAIANSEPDPESIRLLRKSNSGHLASRTWRCKFGVMTVGTNDTYLRARMEAWMDCLRDEWLDSA